MRKRTRQILAYLLIMTLLLMSVPTPLSASTGDSAPIVIDNIIDEALNPGENLYVMSVIGLSGGNTGILYAILDDEWSYIKQRYKVVDTAGTVLSNVDVSAILGARAFNVSTFAAYAIADGKAVITWEGTNNGCAGAFQFAIVDEDGTIVKGATDISTVAAPYNCYTGVTELSNGNIAFMWQNLGDEYLYRIFDSTGNSVTSPASVEKGGTRQDNFAHNSTYTHSLSANDQGQFLITYDIYQNNNYIGAMYDSDGTRRLTNGFHHFYLGSKPANSFSYNIGLTGGNFGVFFRTNSTLSMNIINNQGVVQTSINSGLINNDHAGGARAVKGGGFFVYDTSTIGNNTYLYTKHFGADGTLLKDWTQRGTGSAIDYSTGFYYSFEPFIFSGYDSGFGFYNSVSNQLFLYDVGTAVPATPVDIVEQPSNMTIDAGGVAVFTVEATDATSYQWQVDTGSGYNNVADGGVYTGATSDTLYINGAPLSMNGYMYRVIVNGAASSTATSNAVSLTVNPLVDAVTPSIGTQPANQTVNVNGTATLSVAATVSDSGSLSYQWYSNTTDNNSGGTLIPTANSSSYAAPTGATGSTYYYVVVTNTNNGASGAKTATATSNTARVTVNAAPTFTVSPSGNVMFAALTEGYSFNDTVALNQTITLNKVGTGAITNLAVSLSGGAATKFSLGTVNADSLGDGVLSTSFILRPKTGVAPGTYTETVTITADGGLSQSFQASFTVDPSPTTFTVSETGTVTFDALIQGYTTTQVNGIKKSITLTKVGSGAISNLAASFSGGASSAFTTGTVLPDSLGAGVQSTVVQVFPKLGLAPGTYTETVTITADGGLSESFDVSFTVNPSTFTVSETGTVTFNPLIQGYTTTQVNGIKKSVTLTKVGNGIISNLAVSFSGGASSAFTTGTVLPDSLGAGVQSTVMQVFPKPGLAPGTYTETVTITADGGLSKSFDVSFTVISLVHAATPVINTQPANETVDKGTALTLNVGATISDSGTLYYQWFRNTTNSTAGGTPIDGENSEAFEVPTNTSGTFYYYVGVININNSVNGIKVVNTLSDVAEVTVLEHAIAPSITTQPSDETIDVGDSASLSVAATTSDGGALSYQWYGNTVDSTSGGTLIDGAKAATYAIPSSSAGTFYYYVVVTNTNNSVNGTKTASTTSSLAEVTVLGHAAVPNITTQPSDEVVDVGDSETLSVAAITSDGGTLSYQWYSNTVNSTIGGTLIDGAEAATYAVPSSVAGTYYYYVVVTNTNNSVNGTKTASTTSGVAEVTVLRHAAAPSITTQPSDETIDAGDSASLSIAAATTDSGTLSYQWYSNTVNSTIGGTLIDGAEAATYAVPSSVAGTFYYYVVVTNTNNSVNGTKTASTTSGVAEVTVLRHAATPSITTQPSDETIDAGDSASLSVAATASDGGTLSYQWYSNTVDSTIGGTLIDEAETATYAVPSSVAGTFYYYVVVTNTNNSVNGTKTASTTSSVAEVTVVGHAAAPSITTQPVDEVVDVGDSETLSITATSSDGGALSYQWYSNTVDSTNGGILINGAEAATYAIPSSVAGTYYYYVVVTNTNNSVNGTKTASTTSGVAEVTVLRHAATPSITTQPLTQNVIYGSTASLNITAATTDSGTLSYQWYSNTVNSTIGGTLIDGATQSLYAIPTNAAGSFYYYVVVTNTNNSVNGTKTASTTSSAAEVTVVHTYEIAEVIDQTASPLVQGYAASEVKTITISNTGTGMLTNLAVAVSGSDAEHFVVTQLGESLSAGTATSFTVQAKAGLTAATYSINVTISATNMSNESFAFTQVVELPDPPAKPQQVSAIRGNSQVALAWDAVAGATYYNVYRVTGEGQYTLIDTVAALSYTVESLVNGTEYSFVIRAGNPGGVSDYSAQVQAIPATMAAAPSDVRAIAGNGQATITFIAPADNGGSEITGYEVIASPGNIVATGSASPIVVNGLTNGESYTFTVRAINGAGESEASLPSSAITPQAPSTGSGSGSQSESVEVIVNGKVEIAGIAKKATINGKQVTTIIVDEEKIMNRLAAEGDQAVITIPFTSSSDIVIGEINGKLMKAIKDRNAEVVIRTEQAMYRLPAREINIEALLKQFGNNVVLNDVKLLIEIATPDTSIVNRVEDVLSANGFEGITSPLDFTVSATYGNASIEITSFNSYVERSIAIPAGVDPAKITTGVVVEEDGSIRHVPTNVENIDGQYYAQIHSLSNSVYSVIWNTVVYEDTAAHWASKSIHNMGARLIVNGVSEGRFEPDRNITRAEFAAIVVRALGLKLQPSKASFTDVNQDAWYSSVVQTAYNYGLINGFQDGMFRPEESITRQQAMLIISKAMKVTGLPGAVNSGNDASISGAYKDGEQVASWAVAGVADAISAGIVSGRGDNSLAPQAAITRAEVAVMIERLLQNSDLINTEPVK